MATKTNYNNTQFKSLKMFKKKLFLGFLVSSVFVASGKLRKLGTKILNYHQTSHAFFPSFLTHLVARAKIDLERTFAEINDSVRLHFHSTLKTHFAVVMILNAIFCEQIYKILLTLINFGNIIHNILADIWVIIKLPRIVNLYLISGVSFCPFLWLLKRSRSKHPN